MKRLVVKTLTWRLIAMVLSAGVVYAFTGALWASLGSVVVANVLSTGLYYVHERVWASWG